MPAHTFTSEEIEKLKREAKRMAKREGVPHVGALNRIAVREGFKSWWHLHHHSHHASAGAAAVVPVVANAPGPTALTLEVLLSALKAPSTFVVAVGENRSGHASADFRVARESAYAAAANPTPYAESGPVTMNVTRQQYDLLLMNGAAEVGKVQMFRAFHNDSKISFSAQCDCGSWIFCGWEERSGKCAECRQDYRVAFDLPKVQQSWAHMGWLCMDCGAESKLREVPDPHSPWHPVVEFQQRCNACHLRRTLTRERLEVLASTQRQTDMMVEQVLALTRSFDGAELDALRTQVVADSESLKVQVKRMRRVIAAGGGDEADPEFEKASERLTASMSRLQEGMSRAQLRVAMGGYARA